MGKRGRPKKDENVVIYGKGNVRIDSYFYFVGKLSEFQALTADVRKAFINQALTAKGGTINCLGCQKELTHRYGALYHIDRCMLDDSTKPWNCYRCGYQGVKRESEDHLLRCRGMSAPMLTVNDKGELEDETGAIVELPKRTARLSKQKALKHKKSYRDIRGTCGSQMEYERYKTALEKAEEKIKKEQGELCEQLRRISAIKFMNEYQLSDEQKNSTLNAISMPFAAVKEGDRIYEKSAPKSGKLMAYETAKLAVDDKTAHVGFCQQEIHSIRAAPNQMPNGDEVIAVCCNPSFAVSNFAEPSGNSHVQFWFYGDGDKGKNKNAPLRPWFTLHFDQYILKCEWLERQKEDESSSLIGYLALTVYDQIWIYRIDADSADVSKRADKVQIFNEEPALILKKPERKEKEKEKEGEGEEKENEADSDEDSSNADSNGIPVSELLNKEAEDEYDQTDAPLMSLSWLHENGGKCIASLAADGTILVWDLSQDPVEVKEIQVELHAPFPLTDVALLPGEKLVVAIRDKGIVMLDVASGKMIGENTICNETYNRMKTTNGVLDGFLAFQAEPGLTSQRHYGSGVFIDMSLQVNGEFGICHLLNPHNVLVGEFDYSMIDGAVISCGADGAVNASYNGYLIPADGEASNCTLSREENVLRLERHKKIEMADLDEEEIEQVWNSDAEVVNNMWLTAAFQHEIRRSIPMNYSVKTACLDRRIEQLMSVCVGRVKRETYKDAEEESVMGKGDKSTSSKQSRKRKNDEGAVMKSEKKRGALSIIYTGGIAGCLFAIPYRPAFVENPSYALELEKHLDKLKKKKKANKMKDGVLFGEATVKKEDEEEEETDEEDEEEEAGDGRIEDTEMELIEMQSDDDEMENPKPRRSVKTPRKNTQTLGSSSKSSERSKGNTGSSSGKKASSKGRQRRS